MKTNPEIQKDKSNIQQKFYKYLKAFTQFSKSIGGFFFWAIVLWLFLFEAEQVSSNQMKPSLLQKDMVLISKWQYGARSPQRFWLPFIEFSLPALQLQFPGVSSPKKEEVVAFYYQKNGKTDIAFGRIAAMPQEIVRAEALHKFMPNKVLQEWVFLRTSPKIILPKSRIKALNLEILQQNATQIRVSGTQENILALAKLPYLKNGKVVNKTIFSFLKEKESYQIPKNHYLVLPDNRLGNYPAQIVSAKNLIGKAWRFMWTIDKNGVPKLDRLFRRIR